MTMSNAVAVFLMGQPNHCATKAQIVAAMEKRGKSEAHVESTLMEMFREGRLMPGRNGTVELIQ